MPKFDKLDRFDLIEGVLKELVSRNKLSYDTYVKLVEKVHSNTHNTVCMYLQEAYNIRAQFDPRTLSYYVLSTDMEALRSTPTPVDNRRYSCMLSEPMDIVNKILIPLNKNDVISDGILADFIRSIPDYRVFTRIFHSVITSVRIDLQCEYRSKDQYEMYNAFVFNMSADVAKLLGIVDPTDMSHKTIKKSKKGACKSIW